MSGNPRNSTATTNNTTEEVTLDTSTWKTASLGHGAIKNSKNNREFERETEGAFVINKYTADKVLKLAQAVVKQLDEGNDKAGVTIRISPIFSDANTPESITKDFSHRQYVMRESVEKIGVDFNDFALTPKR